MTSPGSIEDGASTLGSVVGAGPDGSGVNAGVTEGVGSEGGALVSAATWVVERTGWGVLSHAEARMATASTATKERPLTRFIAGIVAAAGPPGN